MVAGLEGAFFVGSRYAAYIDGAASATGHSAPSIAGNDSASVDVVSHHAAGIIGACTVTYKGHIARGIAGGQGGTTIRQTYHAAGYTPCIHCGRGAAPGDGTARLVAHYTARNAVHAAAADAARHRAVFNVAIAPSRHAADIARFVIAFYLYALQLHVHHLAAGADTSEQTRIFVTSRHGQPLDGMAAAVEGAGV